MENSNRVIKFRAWDWNKKIMTYQPEIFLGDTYFYNNAMLGREYNLNLFLNDIKSDSYLMQFTGLIDKNGKEIYEGDILKNYQADVNEVVWFVDSWCLKNYHAEALSLGQYNASSTVIGNIYENKDLLNY